MYRKLGVGSQSDLIALMRSCADESTDPASALGDTET
jgi:hypothetical protein